MKCQHNELEQRTALSVFCDHSFLQTKQSNMLLDLVLQDILCNFNLQLDPLSE
jgi:hypothetical protein